MSPFISDISTEKEVRGTSFGMRSLTSLNTWESVMTRSGRRFSASSMGAMPSGTTEITRQRRSRSSLVICTWGRISRPLGAWMSWGITSITKAPSSTRCAVTGGTSKSVPAFWMRNFLKAPISAGSRASSARQGMSKGGREASPPSKRLTTQTVRTLFSFNKRRYSSSREKSSVPEETTSTARSVLRMTSSVFSVRSPPSWEESSSPAVSMRTTGPMGRSSMDL